MLSSDGLLNLWDTDSDSCEKHSLAMSNRRSCLEDSPWYQDIKLSFSLQGEVLIADRSKTAG